MPSIRDRSATNYWRRSRTGSCSGFSASRPCAVHPGHYSCRAGDEVDQVYFPLSGMVSMVVVMRDGKAIETATVGREGVVGAMSGMAFISTRVRAIARLPVSAGRIAVHRIEEGGRPRARPITDLCIRYNEVR